MNRIIFLFALLFFVENCTAQLLPSGNYVLTLADGGKALDADGAQMNMNDGLIHLWDNNGGTTQVWTITSVGGNVYTIVLAATGKALDADGPGMHTDGGKVHLWELNNGKTQKWIINNTGNNSYSVTLADGGKALDAGISSMYQNDGMVHLWSYNGGKTQQWTFTANKSNNSSTTTTITNLTTMSDADYALWNKAVNDQEGIIGNDFRGFEDIGSACFERQIDTKSECYTSLPKSVQDILIRYLVTPAAYLVDLFGGGISSLNFWFPQHQTSYQPTNLEFYKRTLSGKLKTAHYSDEPCLFVDEDLNLDIEPNQNYNYLISEGKPSKESIPGYVKDEDCPSKFDVVESEINVRQEVRKTLLTALYTRLTENICVYGPWISDHGHCDQPEIHPAEQIWWLQTNGERRYICDVFCDASKRFWWRDQMDDGSKIKPWGAPPIKGLFAIAFDVTLNQTPQITQMSKKYEVSNISDYNVIEYTNADHTYTLEYQGRPLVSFIPHDDAFKVSFEKVGLIPGTTNRVAGFLVLETSVGTLTQRKTQVFQHGGTGQVLTFPMGTDVNKMAQEYERDVFEKVEGHYMFNVTETTLNLKNLNDINKGVEIKKMDIKQ